MASAITGTIGQSLGSLAAGTFGWSAATWSQIGWTAGVMLGTYLFQPDGPHLTEEGPRLDSLKVSTSTYGLDIPFVYGAYRISGNIIWALPLVETRHEETQESGKGGGGSSSTSVWYTYAGTWAIALCEGPINGVRKIWFGSILVYSNGKYYEGLNPANCKIYTGETDQYIDWRMKANKPDSPAYRGTAHIVFSDIELEKFGNTIPNATVEVVGEGTNDVAVFKNDKNQLGTWSDNEIAYLTCAVANTYIHEDDHPILIQFDGQTSYLASMPPDTFNGVISAQFVLYRDSQPKLTNTEDTYSISGDDCRRTFYYIHQPFVTSKCKTGWISSAAVDTGWNAFVRYYDKTNSFSHSKLINSANPIGDVGAYSGISPGAQSTTQATFYKDYFYFLNSIGKSVLKGKGVSDYPQFNFDDYPGDINGTASYAVIGSLSEGSLEAIVGSSTYSGEELTKFDVNYDKIYILTNGPNIAGTYPKNIEIRDLDGLLLDKINITADTTTTDVTYTNMEMFVDDEAIHIVRFDRDYGTYYNKYDLDGNLILKRYPSAFGDIVGNWVGYFNLHGSESIMYKSGLIKFIPRLGLNPNYYSEEITINLGYVAGATTLKTITDDLCRRAGLQPNDCNTDEGLAIVKGYVIPNNMTARAALEPLLTAFEYSIVEKDHQLVLRKQNQTSIANISEDDLGANDNQKIEYNITQELDLIKSLEIRYANAQSDYQTSVQQVRRIDVNAENEIRLELSISLTDDEAKQIAEKYLYRNWLMRQSYMFSLPFSYKDLIAGDVVTISFDNYVQDVRLTKITITENGILQCNAVANNNGVYVSDAIGADTGINEGVVKGQVGLTEFKILDIPTLDNSFIDSEGVYVVATGYSDDWIGCTIHSKTATQDNFTQDYVLIGKTNIGIASGIIGSASPNEWDRINSISILSSIPLLEFTEESLLQGNNYALIGKEVIQFSSVIDNGNSSYTISNLLRGRRGTESHINTHELNEIFVLFNSSTTGFISKILSSDNIYGCMTINSTDTEITNIIQQRYLGNNLKPFSPEYFQGARSGSNIDLNWMRRSRYVSAGLRALPLSESTEKYTLEVYNSSDILQETITDIIIQSYIYDTTAYFILADEVKFKVYQISNIVGKGYASDYLSIAGV